MLRHFTGLLAVVMGIVGALAEADSSRAAGYWNIPGSKCQCWGFGCGAGYHAKFVLGPITCDDYFAHNEVRLPHAPQPACYANDCGYGGYAGYGGYYGGPSVLAPSAQPPAPPAAGPPMILQQDAIPELAPDVVYPEVSAPTPALEPLPEPEPVDMEPIETGPEGEPAEESSALPPPAPVSASRSVLFGPPVER